MCLLEEKTANDSQQGGRYDKYRQWLSENPDGFGVQPRNALLVGRIKPDKKPHC